MKNNLKQMISVDAYNEIVEKVKEAVGKNASAYILPAVIKALEEGSGNVREEILSEWLNVDSMRVCTQCGAIMQEGWYLNTNGYACSDECAAKSEGITNFNSTLVRLARIRQEGGRTARTFQFYISTISTCTGAT